MQPLKYEELDIWWRTVPSSRRFISEIMDAVDLHYATAAHLPPEDVDGFIQMLTEKIQRKHFSSIVEIFDFNGKGDMEDFADILAEKFAPNFLRDFRIDSPMEDLAVQNSFTGYAIIVKLQKKVSWLTDAITDFNKCATPAGGAIIFVTTEENPPPNLTRLSDFLTPYDVQFFAMNLLENSRLNSWQKLYTSTLAAKLSKQSSTMAKNLSKAELYTLGFEFVKTTLPKFNEKIYNRAVWECQAQFLLPALEQIRSNLIEENFSILKQILPVTDEFGKTLDNAWDMELRHLHYYGGSYRLFPYDEWEILEFAYNARNELSHLQTLENSQLEKIFNFVDY